MEAADERSSSQSLGSRKFHRIRDPSQDVRSLSFVERVSLPHLLVFASLTLEDVRSVPSQSDFPLRRRLVVEYLLGHLIGRSETMDERGNCSVHSVEYTGI